MMEKKTVQNRTAELKASQAQVLFDLALRSVARDAIFGIGNKLKEWEKISKALEGNDANKIVRLVCAYIKKYKP